MDATALVWPTAFPPWVKQAAYELAAARSPDDVRLALGRIEHRKIATEALEQLLAEALCSAMLSLDRQSNDTRISESGWQGYASAYVERFGNDLLEGLTQPGIASLVHDWVELSQMAQADPARALIYADGCLLWSSPFR